MVKEEKKPELFTIPTETSWHFEHILKPDDKTVDNYTLIQPGAPDIAKVLQAYSHHPIQGYNIALIEIMYSQTLNRVFYGHMKKMNMRKGNPKFVPKWKSEAQGQEKTQREAAYQQLQQLSQGYADPEIPHVMILPMWHGTNDNVSNHIFDSGYGIFTSEDPTVVTDLGYYGKGVYSAYEAEYAFRSYAKKHGDKAVLLFNWVSVYEAYPIIGRDGLKFEGKGAYPQCDAHFIPVRSDHHPNTDIYYPCEQGKPHQYTEFVVFNDAQCLPRYRVKLVQSVPKHSIDNNAADEYQMALDYFSLYKYAKVQEAFEDAHSANHPAASIRLHWLHSGTSGVIPANPDELQKIQPPTKQAIDCLKYKAHFKGENNQEAQFVLAWCYQHGLGVELNLAKAAQYYWIAAIQGHRDAQYQIGVCCSTGIGVKKDMDKAIAFYQQAAAQGHVHANYLLSQCYEFGLGVAQDMTKAATYKQAAKKGNHPNLAGITLSPVVPAENINTEDKKTIAHLKGSLVQKESQLLQKESQLNQQLIETNKDKQKINELTQTVSKIKQELQTSNQKLQDKDKTISQKESQLNQQLIETNKDKQKINELAQTISTTNQQLIETNKKVTLQLSEIKLKTLDIDGLKSKLNQTEEALQASKNDALNLKKQLEENQKKASNPDLSISIKKPPPHTVLFTPANPQDEATKKDLGLLLKWVTEGHLLEVENLLKKNSNLALMKGTVTDLSGRMFKDISAFQYAAWALDTEMCELMLHKVGNAGTAVADTQLGELEKNPWGHGSHYDPSPLAKKTQEYIRNYDNWSYEKRCEYWQKEVGGEQRKCPAWLIYAWCEEGKEVAWVKKDLKKIKVVRQYEKCHLKWWFEDEYTGGGGVGSSWAVARGSGVGEWRFGVCGSRWLVGLTSHDIECVQNVESKRETLNSLQANLSNKHTMGKK